MDNEIFEILDALAGPVLATIFAYLGVLARKYIKNQTAKGIIERLNDAAHVVTMELHQTLGKEFREANLDGRLTAAEKDHLLDIAKEKVAGYMGVKGLRLLAQVLGITLEQSESYAQSAIEMSVHRTKYYRLQNDQLLAMTKSSEIQAIKNQVESDFILKQTEKKL